VKELWKLMSWHENGRIFCQLYGVKELFFGMRFHEDEK
jgi:hypothetical protein